MFTIKCFYIFLPESIVASFAFLMLSRKWSKIGEIFGLEKIFKVNTNKETFCIFQITLGLFLPHFLTLSQKL